MIGSEFGGFPFAKVRVYRGDYRIASRLPARRAARHSVPPAASAGLSAKNSPALRESLRRYMDTLKGANQLEQDSCRWM